MLNTDSAGRSALQETVAAPEVAPSAGRITDRPLDSALYSCRCGTVFNAAVSANVRCPHCDGEQPW